MGTVVVHVLRHIEQHIGRSRGEKVVHEGEERTGENPEKCCHCFLRQKWNPQFGESVMGRGELQDEATAFPSVLVECLRCADDSCTDPSGARSGPFSLAEWAKPNGVHSSAAGGCMTTRRPGIRPQGSEVGGTCKIHEST